MVKNCIICKGEQDTKIFKEYNICTQCADLMEDLTSEYMLKIINQPANTPHITSSPDTNNQTTSHTRTTKDITKHHKRMEESIKKEYHKTKEQHTTRKRYLLRLLSNIHWLEQNQEFYNHYFEKYYLCPACGEPVINNYKTQKTGNWLIIQCGECTTELKKDFSPELHKLTKK